jgi:Raf kinase inhibitor-like YbhB/YbcL family protein
MKPCFRLESAFAVALALTFTSRALAQSPSPSPSPTPEPKIIVGSAAFQMAGKIPTQYTCAASNVNPPLFFRGVPVEAKSLAVIMDDPDAPGGLFTHWLVWNIDPTVTQISEKSVPKDALQGTNDFGNIRYGGPCPPSGTHRYFFHVFALDQPLDLKAGSKRSQLEKALSGHILARGQLMAYYTR